MPKILINEIDNTKPGTPDGYANYSVLIAGFMGNGDGKTVMPDSNGVYEFSSAQDFIDTIGLMPPKYTKNEVTISHYGNQMAHELLKLGYSIIYLPLNPDTCAAVLADEKTWKIFRDKASYDFRFVYHGLLESTDTTVLDGKKTDLTNALKELINNSIIEADASSYDVKIDGVDHKVDQLTDSQLENVYAVEEAYASLLEELSEGEVPGLIDPNTNAYYDTAKNAAKGVLEQLRDIFAVLKTCITEDTINCANVQIANLACYTAAGAPDADNNPTNDMYGTSIPGRGDCIALIELDEKSYVGHNSDPEFAIIEAVNKVSQSGINDTTGKYCAVTVPSVVYTGDMKMPGAFHYLACFMSSLRSGFAEWYAAAGYTRGVSSYTIERTSVKLGEIAINALEPRNNDGSSSTPKFACNVIANFRGSYYLWGNRTAHPLKDKNGTNGELVASHFLNIRQLCTTLKKQLYVTCRRFTFDPNSDTLWYSFVSAIEPLLDTMKADQGIRGYKILKDRTDKKATLKAKIRIVPIEAVEDFDLTVSLEDSFGETTATVTE